MTKLPLYTTHETVKSFQIDFKSKLRLGTLFGFMQEAAYLHAENLGVGYSNLSETERFWVLSRVIIKVERYPLWNEKLTIDTWPKGINRLFALRDFDIRDEKQSSIIKATTAWLIIDANTRRPVRAIDEIKDIDDNGGRSAIVEFPDKLPLPESGNTKKYIADYTTMDINGHVNNTKYIDWITDCFDDQFYLANEIRELQINFNAEMYWNDELELTYNRDSNTILFAGNNITKNNNAFQARVKLNE